MKKVKILLLCTVLLSFTLSADANLLVNGSFETGSGQLPVRFPTSPGIWAGDMTYFSSSPSQGIRPQDGDQMLKFEFTGFYSAGGYQSGILQLINMSDYAGLIASGNALVTASGYFNRINFDVQTDTLFDLSILALDGTSIQGDLIDSYTVWLDSDSNLQTWEKLTLNYILPTTTTYIAVNIAAHENVFNDGVGLIELDGHYADNITLEVEPVPEPSTMLLMGIGLLGLAGYSRKRFSKKS